MNQTKTFKELMEEPIGQDLFNLYRQILHSYTHIKKISNWIKKNFSQNMNK